MRTQQLQKGQFSLLFFLGERMLERDYSISFGEQKGIPLLFATTEGKQKLFLEVPPEKFKEKAASICNICRQFPTHEVVVPLLDVHQRQEALEFLETKQALFPNLKITRLSLVDRFCYFNRQLEQKRQYL